MRSSILGTLGLVLLFGGAAQSFADEQATKQLEAKLQKVLQAAGQAQAAGAAATQRGNFGYSIPADVDPANKSERVLLFLPGGPVLIETILTIDGQPFQSHREKMIAEALKEADADGDGKATWEEAVAKPGFAGGRFAYLGQNQQVKERTIAQFDQNKDGLVDRVELRSLFAQYTGGPAFMVQNYGFGQQNPPVRELLDLNKDNVLDADEIAAAELRIKSRDANDNDIVDVAELSGNAGGAYAGFQGGRAQPTPAAVLLFHVHSGADWKALFDLLDKRYGKEGKLTAESFPTSPDLVKRLDGNDNGLLEQDELSALQVAEPTLVYEVQLGESSGPPSSGQLRMNLAHLAGPQSFQGGEVHTLEIPGVRLQLASSNPKPNYGNYDAYATQLLNTYDKDKNGYIDKDELGTQPQLAQQFATWDANGDGKVYADEIKQSYQKQQIPTWHRVTLSAADQGNSLYSLLDADNNGRLSLREIKGAATRIKTADKNGDGRITLDEIPGTIRFTVARGNGFGGGFGQVGGGRSVGGAPGAKPAGPEWFVRMDKNGDGDITPREFLGEEEQFKKLDANGDGFIDLKEAEAAK